MRLTIEPSHRPKLVFFVCVCVFSQKLGIFVVDEGEKFDFVYCVFCLVAHIVKLFITSDVYFDLFIKVLFVRFFYYRTIINSF